MLRVKTYITIEQVANNTFSSRNKVLTFDFCTAYNIESSWENLTDTCELIFPKKVYVRDENSKIYNLNGSNKNLGAGDATPPLFMIGDKITINKGYQLDDDTIINTGENGVDNLFTGFIVKVKSHQPITLYCEDNMYRLKQIKAEDKDWKGASIQEMFTEMLQGSGLAVSEKSSVTINYKVGTFITRGETVAQVLERLRKDFRFHSYFRGDELRIGYPIYYTEEARTLVFKFQENIIDSDLQYKRKDDITLSAIASCKIIKETGKTTKDGQKKTKEEALEILVTLKNGKFKYLSKGKNGFPENVEGERRKLFFTGVTTEQELYDLAQPELQKYYYTGLKGSFLTFGTPHVRHGDNVSISDGVLPDRDGTYKVKKVVYEGGVRGLRQEVFLDYKI